MVGVVTQSDVVDITGVIRAGGAPAGGFGSTLFVTRGGGIAASGPNKVQVYRRLSDVTAALGGTSEASLAASAHFAQIGAREFKVGRWAQAVVPTVLTGGAAPAPASDIDDISNGSFRYGGNDFTGVDFSGESTYADQATVIQTALRGVASTDARFSGATVTFENGRFVVTLTAGGDAGAFFQTHSAESGTDISGVLGLAQSDNPTYLVGSPAETIQDALAAMSELQNFSFVCLERTLNGTATMTAAATWAGARRSGMFGASSSERAALTPEERTSVIAGVSLAASERVYGVYTPDPDYLHVAAAARLGATRFEQPSSATTLNLKRLNGQTPSFLTPTQANELDRKNINYYVPFDQGNGFISGTTFAEGTWMDARFFLDWLVFRSESEVFGYMQRAERPSSSGIEETLLEVMEQALRSGMIAPGTVSAAFREEIANTFDNPRFDGFLSNGYLIYVGRPGNPDAGTEGRQGTSQRQDMAEG